MTIARRLMLLMAVPLVAFVGFGFFVRAQIDKVETSSRFVGDTQVPSLVALTQILSRFEEARLSLRTHLLAAGDEPRAEAAAALLKNQEELNRLLAGYMTTLISSDEDRRLCATFQDLARQWSVEAGRLVRLTAQGHRGEAMKGMSSGAMADFGVRAGLVMRDWLNLNEHLATAASQASLRAVQDARRNLLFALGVVLALSAILGLVTYRRIVHPVRGLQKSVEAIAAGDYVHPVPFTQASDETGALARSIAVLKEGAARMAEQRWVKANIAKLTGALQGGSIVFRVRAAPAFGASAGPWRWHCELLRHGR